MYNDHTVGVTTLDVFRMDGNVFCSGSIDLTFRVWDIRMKNACFRKSVEGESGVSVVKFMPENIDPSLCTHLVYSFAKLANNKLAPFEWNDDSTDWSTGL